MHSTHNEKKISFYCKIYQHMASLSKNVYINKLDGIVNDYNNTDHRAIKMKLVDVKTNTYFDSIKEVNDRDHW